MKWYAIALLVPCLLFSACDEKKDDNAVESAVIEKEASSDTDENDQPESSSELPFSSVSTNGTYFFVTDLLSLIYYINDNSITSLSFSRAAFSDLSPISLLTGLEELYISSSENISDISPLRSLLSLKKLSIVNNDNIESIEPLSSLVNLEYLDLWYTDKYYRELVPLRQLSVLKLISGVPFPQELDISYIAQLQSLKELAINVQSSALFNIEQLRNLTNLERLSIRFHNELDISWITSLQNLKELELQGSTIVDITPLLLLPELTDVNLLRTTVRDISPLLESTTIKRIFGPIVENGVELWRLFSARGIDFQQHHAGDR